MPSFKSNRWTLLVICTSLAHFTKVRGENIIPKDTETSWRRTKLEPPFHRLSSCVLDFHRREAFFDALPDYRKRWTGPHSGRDVSAEALLRLRGGSGIDTVSTTTASVGSLVRKFIAWVGAAKTRCWTLLVICILFESASTNLSKYAKETGSVPVFALACFIYLTW